MEFRIQDILKNVIPGMILSFGIGSLFINSETQSTYISKLLSFKDFSEILLLILLTVCYLIGYVNDGISSWCEQYVIYFLFGPPSLRLLRGKGKRLLLVNSDKVLQNLQLKMELSSSEIDLNNGSWFYYKSFWKSKERAIRLFKYANDLKNANPHPIYEERIREYYNSYTFSRNLFFSSLISNALFMVSYNSNLQYKTWLLIFILLTFLGLRRRDKSYYYSRQVFQACNFD
jgi:hypothetical protein